MKTPKMNFMLLCLVILLATCQPTSFQSLPITEVKPEPTTGTSEIPPPSATVISNISQTKKGVTLTVTNVNYSDTETFVTFVVQVDPQWGLDIHAFLPPQALYNNPLIFDETGKQYSPISGTFGAPQLDTETGGVKFQNTATFPPVESSTIVFQTEIEISEIPISLPVAVSISNHHVLDIWSINQGITFSDFTDIPGQVKLLSRSDRKIELEFTFDRVTSDGLQLGCLSFLPDNQDVLSMTNNVSRECMEDERQVVSKVGMDLPIDETLPISFHVTANVVFTEPFTVSWSTIK